MNLIAWIVVGAIAGWLAGKVVKGHGMGLLGNIIVGVIGALLGGWLSSQLGLGVGVTGFNLMSILVAFGGSVVLLLILRLFNR